MKIKKNWLEWSVFFVSLLLVIGTFICLLYWTSNSHHNPPQIVLKLGKVEVRSGHYAMPVDVVNQGDHTAEGVLVSVELVGENEEKAEFEIPFLPHNSTRQGTAIFSTDPQLAERLDAKILGYRNP